MIVVIEDSATQRLQLVRDVRNGGWEVTAAADGESGLEAARALDPPPLAIVTDILMPGIDGWEVCRRIRTDPRLAGVAVIVLTELSRPADVLRAVVAGADNYCTKPYAPDRLVARIRRAIEQKAGGSSEVEVEGETFSLQNVPPRIAHVLASTLEDAAQRYRELARSRADLQAAYADREAMTRVVVHELRSPLQAMLAAAQIAQRRPEILNDLPALVERQGQRVRRILDDLSDLTRIELGQLPVEPVDADLAAVVRGAIDRIRPSVPTHRVDLDAPASPLRARVDADRIEQVLTNLITNAVKYSPDADRVHVAVRRAGDRARVEVRDWGIGVPPDHRERIFERYFRSRGGESTAEGLGIGLFVTRHLVRTHGGTIGVDPAPDRGSVFWFELPLADAAAEPEGAR